MKPISAKYLNPPSGLCPATMEFLEEVFLERAIIHSGSLVILRDIFNEARKSRPSASWDKIHAVARWEMLEITQADKRLHQDARFIILC